MSKAIVWRRKVSVPFTRRKSDPKAEGQRVCPRMPLGPLQHSTIEWPLSTSKGAVSGFSGELCFGSSSESSRLVDGGGSLALELDARFRLLEKLRVLVNLEACTERVAPFLLELQSGHRRYVRLSSLKQRLRGNGWERLLFLRVSSSVLGSRRRVDGRYWTQAARAARHWLLRRQCFSSVSRLVACGVSRNPICS